MVKFIGADKQGNASDTFKAPGINPQSMSTSDKSFQFAQQQQQQLGESLKSSLAFQSQTASRMSEDFSRTNQSSLQSSMQTLQSSSQSGGDFSKAMGNLANVGNMLVQTLDNRAKQEAAQAKAVRESNASSMWERVSQWEVDAAAKARLDPGGTVRLRSEAADMFNSTEGSDLLPEDREKLMKHVYGGVIAGLATKNVEDLMTQQRKLQEVNINTRKERAIFESSSLLSSLGASSTQEEQATSITKLSEYLGQVALSRDLDPMSKAEIQLALTTQMNKAMFTSEDNRNKAQETIVQFNTFQKDVQQARANYPNDIESQNAAIAYSAFRNKIPTAISENYDVVKAQERGINRIKLNNEERDLRSQEIADKLGVAGTSQEAGYLAEMHPSEADMIELARELGGGNVEMGQKTGKYLQVVAAQKLKKEFITVTETINRDIGVLEGRKAEIAVSDAAANLDYMRTLKPTPQTASLIERIKLLSQNNPALQSMIPLIGQYEQLDAQRKQAFDNAFAQATAQGFSARAERIAAIDLEAAALKDKRVRIRDELVRYGYRIDGTYDPVKAKALEEMYTKRKAEQDARNYERMMSGGSQGGTAPGAPFDDDSSYFNGLEVFNEQQGLIMPITKAEIKRQGAANINEGVGWRARVGRQHNGQDIGVDLGTPIVAQLSGKVTRVWGESDEGAGSSGNTVEVTYTDGSRHVFMHLSERSSLTVGQRVKAGQVVGKAGNTGLPGGNANINNVHLHWEVWYGDTRATPQEWSSKYRQMMQNKPSQPRGGGPGSSITAPVRGVQGIPIKGGVLVPNGRGGASVASYSDASVPSVIGEQYLKNNGIKTPDTVMPTANGMLRSSPIPGSKLSAVTLYKPDGTKQGVYTLEQSNPVLSGNRNGYTLELKSPYDSTLATLNTRNTLIVQSRNSVLKDSGQQKQRVPIPAKQSIYATSKTYVGPRGKVYTRDVNGNLVAVPDPVGVSSGGVSSFSGGYSSSNPLRNLRNSNRTSDYNLNDVTNTHGFKALQNRPSAARTINEVARDFGVPGEWLAEVISIETDNTFDPNTRERGGSGATGLIQFFPDNDGGSTKTINGRVYNLSDIGKMSIEQQLRGPVKDYLQEAMRSNGMKKIPTIQDLYALVWAYGPASKARKMRDMRGPSGNEILNRLGKFSGRRYSSHTNHSTNIAQADTYSSERTSKLTQRVDQRPVNGCSSCAQMVASNMFVPHERVNLSTGMETFNLA